MGVTKDHLFTRSQNDLAAFARVLAHPARIAILQFLARSGTCMNGSLVDKIGLAQPTISQHLWELKNAGLIRGTIEGTAVCYCIDPIGWKKLRDQLDGLLSHVEDNCC